MTNLVNVARQGREAALARIGGTSMGGASRSRSNAAAAVVTFSSVRAGR